MTQKNWTRRHFMKASAAGAALPFFTAGSLFADEMNSMSEIKEYKTKLYSGFIRGNLDAATIESLAAIGAQGIETNTWDIDVSAARDARKIAEVNGLRIHSVMRGWTNLNQLDMWESDLASLTRSLQAAAAYGADAILLVPCRVDQSGSPAPWDFQIEFDPGTCHVTKVVAGDEEKNAEYAEYIRLQNEATERTYAALETIIPIAAYEGVTIALENVWNGLWVKPELAAAFVNMFDNRWVKAYFDMGNHVKYASTESWLRALKGSLTKLHFKDFLVNREKPNGGDFVPINQGSINWQSVRDVIEEIGYSGWVTYEDVNYYTPEQHVQLFNDFAAGRPISVK